MPVYAIRKVGTDRVKIGISTNVERRLRSLELAVGEKLELLHTVNCDNPYVVERELHKMYKGRKTLGEWFAFADRETPLLFVEMNFVAAKSQQAIESSEAKAEDESGWLREAFVEAFVASGLTPRQLAKQLNMPVGYIRSVIEGPQPLTPKRIARLARALGIEVVASPEPSIFPPVSRVLPTNAAFPTLDEFWDG